MKKDNKKALYESIMASVAKEVKKVLNELTTIPIYHMEDLDLDNNDKVNKLINIIKFKIRELNYDVFKSDVYTRNDLFFNDIGFVSNMLLASSLILDNLINVTEDEDLKKYIIGNLSTNKDNTFSVLSESSRAIVKRVESLKNNLY